MKKLIAIAALLLISTAVFAVDKYEIERDPYNSNEIQMREKYNYDPAEKYRGSIDDGGSVQMRNLNGDTMRGTIDEDGSGRLRDQDGNIYRVR